MSKNEPSKFDVWEKLDPNESYFILRAQDDLAPDLIDTWSNQADALGCLWDKVRNAREIAQQMREWRLKKNPD